MPDEPPRKKSESHRFSRLEAERVEQIKCVVDSGEYRINEDLIAEAFIRRVRQHIAMSRIRD